MDNPVYVELGPVPAVRRAQPRFTVHRYAFNAVEDAENFAAEHKQRDPYRVIHIHYPDGRSVKA